MADTATITSASSEADINNAYLDNCGWYELEDVAMARRFVTVCTAMRSRGITTLKQGSGEEIGLSPSDLQTQINEAKEYINTNRNSSTGGGVKFVSFNNFRD